jgi:hypothetical protein
VQHTIVARAWREAGLDPHRLERYMRSTDPDFETKVADVIGLYLDQPQHAVGRRRDPAAATRNPHPMRRIALSL